MAVLKKNSILFSSEDKCQSMYLIKSGKVIITKEKGNRLIPVSLKKEKELISETQIFQKEALRGHTAFAGEETEIIEISNEEVKEVFKLMPKWAHILMEDISDRLENIRNFAEDHNITERDEELRQEFDSNREKQIMELLKIYKRRKKD